MRRQGPKQLDEQWRSRIQTTKIIERLKDHALGNVEMTATQVQAARTLLAKTVPDMKAVEHKLPSGTALNFSLYVPNKDA